MQMENTLTINGYQSTCVDDAVLASAPDTTTEEYDRDQRRNNVRVTREYVEPLLRRLGCNSVLDVGCGVGTGVETLLEDGFDAYGVDLPGLTAYWERSGYSRDRYFVVAPNKHRLPFEDGTLDAAYTFGVLEHIGTLDGHAIRAPDYHEERAHWLREIYRCIRPGGYMLLGGPNRGFPLDFSHGLDSQATPLERWLSSKAGMSVHRTWGEYFLWSYRDIPRYLHGLPHSMQALSIDGLLQYGRVPRIFRGFATQYIKRLPSSLLDTGFNPWVMALVRREER